MSLIIIDAGYRIQTPVESQFPAQGINGLTQAKATHDAAGRERRVDADGENFTHLLEAENHARSRPPPKDVVYEKPAGIQERPRGITAEQIMSQPVHTIPRETTFQATWDRMEVLGVGHLITVDADDKPVGIISRSDVREHGKNSPVSIANFYSQQMIAASPDTEASLIAHALVEHHINAVPIFNNDEQLVGIVTRSDLLRLIITGAHLERWA